MSRVASHRHAARCAKPRRPTVQHERFPPGKGGDGAGGRGPPAGWLETALSSDGPVEMHRGRAHLPGPGLAWLVED
jgi:hypothetical protein